MPPARRSTSAPLSPSREAQGRDRYEEIAEAAATLFVERGYSGTSIRDIGDRVGLMGGSLYYHIKSKETLYIEIHRRALEEAGARIRHAVSELEDPWDRLGTAIYEFLQAQLEPNSATMPLVNEFRTVPKEIREQLVPARDAFEEIFVALVEALPLKPDLDRRIYRICLLTLLNDVSVWYRADRELSLSDITKQIVGIFDHRPG